MNNRSYFLLLVAFLAVTWIRTPYAAPFLPANDDQVLERLPTSTDLPARELRTLREQLAQEPRNLKLATHLAQRYIEVGRAESDPRYYGYAQAALRPWWDQPQPPAALLLLRATLRQNRHEFAAALDDLARVLEVQPRNAQAWLTRAVILQVQGDYAEARQSFARLSRLAEPLVVAACIGNVMGLQGQGEVAERLLKQNLQSSPQADVQLRLWALTVLAELESRRGDEAAAEKHFQEALGLGVRDSYLLGAYADWLLDRGRMEDVRRLLQDETRTDGSLLRLALAKRGLGDPSLDHHLVDLKARFEAGRQRGDNSIHQREQARAMLHLFDQSGEALELALRNWAVQREPWDARLVLEAALATRKPEAARPVLDWLAQTGLEDLRLAQLSEQLRGI